MKKKLTDYELDAQSGIFNLADGHARYILSEVYPNTLEAIGHYLQRNKPQEDMERDFQYAFFTAAGQPQAVADERILFCPSASLSIEIVANFLRMNKLSVSLIEPVFDNLADILKRHHVELHSLPEREFHEKGLSAWLEQVRSDAIFLVIPNNPTGYTFSNEELDQIVSFCANRNLLLIIDFCFRFFSPEMAGWDQYRALNESGVRYITVEDTGKTWATFELKVGTLMADEGTFKELVPIYRDLFISVSPLGLCFVTSYIQSSMEIGFEQKILSIARTNRKLLRDAIRDTYLRPLSYVQGSTEWIRIDGAIDDLQLVDHLREHHLYILPGRKFYWNEPVRGSRFVRIALMRDGALFSEAVNVLLSKLPVVPTSASG